MELRLPLEMSPGREAACRAVFGTWRFFSERCTEKLPLRVDFIHRVEFGEVSGQDRKSTRLNSSHQLISYAVFCLKKKKNKYGSSRMRARERVSTHSLSGRGGS